MALHHLAEDLDRALDAESAASLRGRVPRALLVTPCLRDLLVMAAFDWALILLAWTAMALGPTWALPVGMLVVASRIHSFGVILHDAAHMPLRGKTWQVRGLELLCGYPLATTLNAMRYHHLRHHRDSGMASDPYFKDGVDDSAMLYALNILRGLLLMPFWTVRAWFGLAAVVLPGLRHPYGRVFLQDRSGDDLTDNPEVLDCARAELGQAIFQGLVLFALVLWPRAVLLYYVVPAVIAGLLAAWRLLREHRYQRATDRKLATIIATTNDSFMGGPLKWLLAPRNIGFHVVHHLHPQVSLRALPPLRDWYRQELSTYPPPGWRARP